MALALPGTAFADFSSKDKGTSGAQFLKIGPGARPAGMGEAFSAVSDDIHGLYYNPAGLASLRAVEFGGMHNQYFQSLDYNFGAVAVPLQRFRHKKEEMPEDANGVLGLAVYNLSVNDLQRRGLSDSNIPTGTFGASDSAYALSYARRMGKGLSLGVTGKAIMQKIDDKSATSFAMDAGALLRRECAARVSGDCAVSAGLRNLGTRPKFDRISDPLPLLLYTGGSFRMFHRLTLALDLDFPRDNDMQVAVGAEYTHPFSEAFNASLRGGYFTQNTDPSGLAGLSLGAGLGYKQVSFDFAWVPFGVLGNTFRYSVLLKF